MVIICISSTDNKMYQSYLTLVLLYSNGKKNALSSSIATLNDDVAFKRTQKRHVSIVTIIEANI